MGYRTRIYYTDSDKALMWDRWQAGDSLREIAHLFNRQHSSIRGIFNALWRYAPSCIQK